jgi:hypothetical protein
MAVREVDGVERPEAALETCKTLTGIGFRRTGRLGPAGEPVVEALPPNAGPVRFRLVGRHTLKAEGVAALMEVGEPGGDPPLVAVPYVDPLAAERARDLGLAFVDRAGNAHLRGPGLFVFVTGRRPAAKPRPVRAPRALTPAGLKVVFALLVRPQLADVRLRDIAAETGVALGTVGAVMEDLTARGLLTAPGGDARRLLEPRRLAEEWTAFYPVRLRPKLVRGRYAAPDPVWWEKARIPAGRAVFGGEVAADRLTGHLKPARVTLYVWGAPDEVILANRLRPDERGAVEILEAFWAPIEGEAAARQVAPPLLVYADLMATGDARNLDVARLVRERYLASMPSARIPETPSRTKPSRRPRPSST